MNYLRLLSVLCGGDDHACIPFIRFEEIDVAIKYNSVNCFS